MCAKAPYNSLQVKSSQFYSVTLWEHRIRSRVKIVHKFFKSLAKLASSLVWRVVKNVHSSSQKRKQLAQNIKTVSEGEKTLARLVSGFVFLHANPEFYSHLASGRVVIRTPATGMHHNLAYQRGSAWHTKYIRW
jgi:hypothetical protein